MSARLLARPPPCVPARPAGALVCAPTVPAYLRPRLGPAAQVHSLGELLPMHTYTTEYGNELVRTTKHKVVLAGSIEIDVTSDECDFDGQMTRLAVSHDENSKRPTTEMRMASYAAFTKNGAGAAGGDAAATAANGGGAAPPSGSGWAANGGSAAHSGSGSADADARASGGGGGGAGGHAATVADSARLQEDEAMQRIGALVARLGEMEAWFAGVKAEAERERRMREQLSVRLSVMQVCARESPRRTELPRCNERRAAIDCSLVGGRCPSASHPVHQLCGSPRLAIPPSRHPAIPPSRHLANASLSRRSSPPLPSSLGAPSLSPDLSPPPTFALAQERVDLLNSQVTGLRSENSALRRRLADVATARDEDDYDDGSLDNASVSGSVRAPSVAGSLVSLSARSSRGIGGAFGGASRPLSSVRGGI